MGDFVKSSWCALTRLTMGRSTETVSQVSHAEPNKGRLICVVRICFRLRNKFYLFPHKINIFLLINKYFLCYLFLKNKIDAFHIKVLCCAVLSANKLYFLFGKGIFHFLNTSFQHTELWLSRNWKLLHKIFLHFPGPSSRTEAPNFLPGLTSKLVFSDRIS